MWGHVKQAMVDSAREVCDSVKTERKMNEDVNGNKKLFWKKVNNAKGVTAE